MTAALTPLYRSEQSHDTSLQVLLPSDGLSLCLARAPEHCSGCCALVGWTLFRQDLMTLFGYGENVAVV